MQSLEREEDEEELNGATTDTEDQEELDKEVVGKLIKEKQDMQGLNPCKRMRRSSKEKWGPVQVDKPRRNQNNAGTVLQKAMQIKKKKNLEGIKGNSFAVL
jgi:hypothetical protein